MKSIQLKINVPAPIPISALPIFEKKYVPPGTYTAQSLTGHWVKITLNGENIFLPGSTYKIIEKTPAPLP